MSCRHDNLLVELKGGQSYARSCKRQSRSYFTGLSTHLKKKNLFMQFVQSVKREHSQSCTRPCKRESQRFTDKINQ